MQAAGEPRRLTSPLAAALIALAPALGGCSSASSPSGDVDYAAKAYPSQSLVDLFKHASDPPTAQSAPAGGQSNCPPAAATPQAGPSATPASCASVAVNSSPSPSPSPPPPEDPVASAYPHGTSAVEFFKNLFGQSTPAQQASIPHPPSTYTPVSDPYGTAPPAVPPPPVQGAPTAQPAAAPSANITGYPQQALISPKPAAADAAAAPPPADANPTAGVYPQQSLVDLFTKKPASQ